MALMAPIVLRSMQGICTKPATWVAGEAQIVFHANLGRVLDLLRRATHDGGQARCGHRAGYTDFALTAHLGG